MRCFPQNKKNIFSIKLIIVLFALGMLIFKAPQDVKAEQIKANGNKKIQILFVGNSKTSYNQIPGKFKELAKAGKYNVEVSTVMQNQKTLDYLGKKYAKTLKNKKAAYVILQESTEVMLDYKQYYYGVKRVINLVKAKNPKVKIILRDTWLTQDATDSQKREAHANTVDIAKRIGAKVCNDGTAMYTGMDFYSSLDLLVDDRHQTKAGAYLVACCIYNSVFGKSVYGNSYTAGLKRDTAKLIQNIADNIRGKMNVKKNFKTLKKYSTFKVSVPSATKIRWVIDDKDVVEYKSAGKFRIKRKGMCTITGIYKGTVYYYFVMGR